MMANKSRQKSKGADSDRIDRMLTPKLCSVCGKEFYPAPMHVYKAGNKLACSYSCAVMYRHFAERKPNRRSKTVAQYSMDGTLLATYPSVSNAQKSTGIDSGGIAEAARGVTASAGGFVWRYVSN